MREALLLFLSVPPKALLIDQPVDLFIPGTLKTTPPWSTRDWLQRALEDMTVVAMEKVPMATEIRTSKTLRPSETQRKTFKDHEQRSDEQRFYNPITSNILPGAIDELHNTMPAQLSHFLVRFSVEQFYSVVKLRLRVYVEAGFSKYIYQLTASNRLVNATIDNQL